MLFRSMYLLQIRKKVSDNSTSDAIGKPIHVWIDEWVLESLKERDREITLRKKLYGKPTRKGRKKKICL